MLLALLNPNSTNFRIAECDTDPSLYFNSEGFFQPQRVNKRYAAANGRVNKSKQGTIAWQHAALRGLLWPTFLYVRPGCVNIRSVSSENLESVFSCGLRSFRAACHLRDDMYCRPPSAPKAFST